MTLLAVRNLFIERSGREDLHDPSSGADNGADFFIQSGQKTIERLLQFDKSWARNFTDLTIDEYYTIFEGCRAIKAVWISNSSGRSELTKMTIEEFRNKYSDAPNEITSGTPLYYTPISLRTYPDEAHVVIDNLFGSKITDLAATDFSYKGIIISPPTDETAVLEVFGLFKSKKLTLDADINVWTEAHPEILLLAALYHLEVSYRNSEGAKDWMNALVLELTEMEKDWVEEDIAKVTQIVG